MTLPVVLLALAGTAAQAPSGEGSAPAIESVLSGARACATGKLTQERMAERLAVADWKPGAIHQPRPTMTMKAYHRGEVTLYYFTSKPMTQCIVRAATGKHFPVDKLMAGLSLEFGKSPKVDAPGRRYLYPLPRLDILTLQIKSDAEEPHVELRVVH